MSKRAEEAALKAYPDYLTMDGGYVTQIRPRKVFIQGYEQAEKDLSWHSKENIGWISVKDRLPEKNGLYFTCVEISGIPQCVGITYFDKEDGWWLNDIPMGKKSFMTTIEIVDYWMDIPALPKEEEK